MADTYAADDKKTGAKLSKTEAEEILVQARADYDRAMERERDNIEKAYKDLEFCSGDEMCQWDANDRKLREGRPTLQLNQLPQFIHQITGDIRQMKPSIKVVPVDSEADEKRADLYGGLIRYIENRSDASAVYFRAADSQVACGIGHWRVQTEYADSSTFNQEIRIAPVDDGVAVLWDPDAVLPTKEDAGFCHVPVDMSRAAFEKAYPDTTPDDFGGAENWAYLHEWVTDDYIRVSEYWVRKPSKKLLALQLDGSIADVTDAEDTVIARYQAMGARIEERDSTKVCRYLMTATEILEGPSDWPGRFIPIVPCVGVEIRIGRKVIRKGIVRDAQDAQRMVNYFQSAHAEVVALQPKSPFIGTELNFAKYQGMWEKANTESQPYLPYTPDPQNGGAQPSRVQPPVSSQGVIDGLMMSLQAMKSIIGIYDPGLGEKSNETSGKAIIARQREGDVGSYVYIDNFARAVRHTGNIIVDLIPHVYDTERTIRIMGEDGKIDVMEINKAAGLDPQGQETVFENDITVGSYDVVATVGPSYTTKREEAKEGMIAFIQAAPDAAPLVLDLVAKSQDWPMSDDFSKRLRATLPPHIIQMEEMEKQGASPEQIQEMMNQARQQQQPDPKVMEAQAKIQMDGQRLQFEQTKAGADAEREQMKLAAEQQNKDAERQFQMAQLAEQSRLKELELAMQDRRERDKAELDARVRIQIAEINAQAKERDTDIRAAVAKYATDNRPQPNGQ